MADSQALEASIAAATAVIPTTTTAAAAATVSAAVTTLIPFDNHTTTVTTTNTNNNNFGAILAPKRQRRPSVRLGEIGGDGKARRPRTNWRFYKDPAFAAKASKTRPITNLVTINDNGNGGGGGVGDNHYSEINFDFGKGRTKSKKPRKKVRTNWTSSRLDTNGINNNHNHANSTDNDNDNRELREFELEDAEAEAEGSESPVHSIDNVANEHWQGNRRMVRARVSDNELPELNSQDRKCSCDGVREWLIGLGLSRYSPVFQIHEVDDEVLPMLTLEDLKDMGINAVGSRRKMYTAILKLRKGFS